MKLENIKNNYKLKKNNYFKKYKKQYTSYKFKECLTFNNVVQVIKKIVINYE